MERGISVVGLDWRTRGNRQSCSPSAELHEGLCVWVGPVSELLEPAGRHSNVLGNLPQSGFGNPAQDQVPELIDFIHAGLPGREAHWDQWTE